MAEWSKARAWKVRIPVKGYRGFESLSLRHGIAGGTAAGQGAMEGRRACSSGTSAHLVLCPQDTSEAMKPLLQGTAERSEAHPFIPNFGASSIVASLFIKQPEHPHTH